MPFKPESFRSWRSYDRRSLVADVLSGVTVGVIALPLAIGFGIASGVTPNQGLWTAIVAGLIVSLLGGTRFQIGGPTGAFVPVLALIVAQHGYEGLALATMMAGVMLILMGALKMGRLIKFIPYPVTAGFTSGIAVIIFTGQLNEFLGLGLKMPDHVPQQVGMLWEHLAATNGYALGLGALTLLIAFGPAESRAKGAAFHRSSDCLHSARAGAASTGCDDSIQIRRHPSGWPGWAFPGGVAGPDARADGPGLHHRRAGGD